MAHESGREEYDEYDEYSSSPQPGVRMCLLLLGRRRSAARHLGARADGEPRAGEAQQVRPLGATRDEEAILGEAYSRPISADLGLAVSRAAEARLSAGPKTQAKASGRKPQGPKASQKARSVAARIGSAPLRAARQCESDSGGAALPGGAARDGCARRTQRAYLREGGRGV